MFIWFVTEFFFVKTVSFAVVTTTFSSAPQMLLADPFTITATISGASSGTNYLRVDIYKDQTTNYFGETFNGSYWYTGSDHTQFLPITIQSGVAWTGTIQAKVGDPSNTDYDGTGVYKLRLRRYTSSGSYTSSEANVNAITVNIAIPTQTPTPTPTSIPTTTPLPTPTKTPTVVPTATLTPLPTVSPTLIATIIEEEENDATEEALAIREMLTEVPTTKPQSRASAVKGATDNKLYLGFLLVGSGIFACGILAFYIIQKREQ